MSTPLNILAIETSCDETSVAVLRSDQNSLQILSNIVSSQVKLHAQWGGVVPNLAAREHVKNLPTVLGQTLEQAKINLEKIDLIAVVNGPGLIPALMIGTNFAKTLSYRHQKPLIGIHHIEGHIYANWISQSISGEKIKFPALSLVVSGGHTQLVLMRDHLKYEIVGQTLDDAVGEAFDKVARILNLGYPGGPEVSRRGTYSVGRGANFEISLPRPMLNSGNFDFSFSGLKTAVLYETQKHPDKLKDENYINAVCREFQEAVSEVLIKKTLKAIEQFQPQSILLAGGVSANSHLRENLGKNLTEKFPGINYFIPDLSLTGDNAAMIAVAAHFRWQKMSQAGKKTTQENWRTLTANANLKMS